MGNDSREETSHNMDEAQKHLRCGIQHLRQMLEQAGKQLGTSPSSSVRMTDDYSSSHRSSSLDIAGLKCPSKHRVGSLTVRDSSKCAFPLQKMKDWTSCAPRASKYGFDTSLQDHFKPMLLLIG